MRNPPLIKGADFGNTGGLLLGGTMIGSRTNLDVFQAVPVSGACYCAEIILSQ